MDIVYSKNKSDLIGLEVSSFFDNWPDKPNNEILKKSIENANYIVLAIDTEKKKLVGYITGLTDDVLAAYIPFLEVAKSYQSKGIGKTLVKKLLEQMEHLYMIDLVCDKEKAGFYEDAGFQTWNAMIKRNYANQRGSSKEAAS